jgi:transcriptional regulator with XRE-family HTH domain
MQELISSPGLVPEIRPYDLGMQQRAPKSRPAQGARLADLRRAAGLTQVELAKLLGETQQNITFWEHSDKPPRSEILPKLAKVLGVSVEQLLGISPLADRRPGPVGKTQKAFEEVARLPRSQQDKIVEIVEALVDQFKRKAS